MHKVNPLGTPALCTISRCKMISLAFTTATVKAYLKPRRLPRLIRSARRCPVPQLILERADAWAASLGRDGYTILRDGSGTRWRVESYQGYLQVSDAYVQRKASRVWRATPANTCAVNPGEMAWRKMHAALAVRWSWYDNPSGARGYLTHPYEA